MTIKIILAIFVVMISTGYCAPNPDKGSVQISSGTPKSVELNERGVSAMKAKDFKLSEELFKQSLSVDPNNLAAIFNLASVYIVEKKEAAAISLLIDTTAKYPKDAGLFLRLGDAYFSSKKIDQALSAYEKALSVDPKYLGIRKKLATCFTLKNRFKDAERSLLAALEENRNDNEVLSNLSSIYLINGKTQEAIGAAKRALQVRPTANAYKTLGSAYEALQDFPNSLISFQKAADLGDKSAELTEKIETLKKITDSKKG